MRHGAIGSFVGGACLLSGVSAAALIPFARPAAHPDTATSAAHAGISLPPLALVDTAREEPASAPRAGPMTGLDLSRVEFDDGVPTANAQAGKARLTLDGELQRTATALMRGRRLSEAAVVLMDTASGRLLVYASHVEDGPERDLCALAEAPSASLFKIVTAAALIEEAHLGPDTRQCYLGGEHRILAVDLIDDARRDRWCTTLAGAMGRSINAVFARLASEHLTSEELDRMARRFGYGQALPFDVAVQPSAIHVPSEPLEFARTAAGFWNSTLSPIQAAEISAIVARGGEESIRPHIVDKIVDRAGGVVWSAPEAPSSSRIIGDETAKKIAMMMQHTVSQGTSWHAFHDAHGGAFLPGLTVAGRDRKPSPTPDPTAITPGSRVSRPPSRDPCAAGRRGRPRRERADLADQGETLAREVLRAYFASRGSKGVTPPLVGGRRSEGLDRRARAIGR